MRLLCRNIGRLISLVSWRFFPEGLRLPAMLAVTVLQPMGSSVIPTSHTALGSECSLTTVTTETRLGTFIGESEPVASTSTSSAPLGLDPL